MQGAISIYDSFTALGMSFLTGESIRLVASLVILPILQQFQKRRNKQPAPIHLETICLITKTSQQLLQVIRELLAIIFEMSTSEFQRLLHV